MASETPWGELPKDYVKDFEGMSRKEFQALYTQQPEPLPRPVQIIVVRYLHSRMQMESDDHQIRRFNHDQSRCHIRHVAYGDGLAGYRADLIFILDEPSSERDMEWIEHVLKLRLMPKGVMLGHPTGFNSWR